MENSLYSQIERRTMMMSNVRRNHEAFETDSLCGTYAVVHTIWDPLVMSSQL